MKLFIFITILSVGISAGAFSQTDYLVQKDNKTGGKLLRGIISKDLLAKDTAFAWYAKSRQGFVPDAAAVKTLQSKSNREDISLIIFCGTWCSDSKTILPRLFSYLEAGAYPEQRVTLIALDRLFNTVKDLSIAWKVSNIPTVIVLKDGREIGRVEENGKAGQVDKSLAELLVTIE